MPIFAYHNNKYNMRKYFICTKDKVRQNVNAGFPINIQYMDKELKDKNNVQYSAEIYYIENSVHITSDFARIMNDVSSAARDIMIYILDNIPYGTNVISLEPKILKAKLKLTDNRISEAMKQLKEHNLLVKGTTVKHFKNPEKYEYVINHNYLYKGSYKELYKDLILQTDLF